MAEVPEVDYTAEEEAAMGGETQPEGETPSVKTPEGVEADPTRQSPWKQLNKNPGTTRR